MEGICLLFIVSFPLSTKEKFKSNFDNFQWLDDQINFKSGLKGSLAFQL